MHIQKISIISLIALLASTVSVAGDPPEPTAPDADLVGLGVGIGMTVGGGALVYKTGATQLQLYRARRDLKALPELKKTAAETARSLAQADPANARYAVAAQNVELNAAQKEEVLRKVLNLRKIPVNTGTTLAGKAAQGTRNGILRLSNGFNRKLLSPLVRTGTLLTGGAILWEGLNRIYMYSGAEKALSGNPAVSDRLDSRKSSSLQPVQPPVTSSEVHSAD